jgi:hypothetical protein
VSSRVPSPGLGPGDSPNEGRQGEECSEKGRDPAHTHTHTHTQKHTLTQRESERQQGLFKRRAKALGPSVAKVLSWPQRAQPKNTRISFSFQPPTIWFFHHFIFLNKFFHSVQLERRTIFSFYSRCTVCVFFLLVSLHNHSPPTPHLVHSFEFLFYFYFFIFWFILGVVKQNWTRKRKKIKVCWAPAPVLDSIIELVWSWTKKPQN